MCVHVICLRVCLCVCVCCVSFYSNAYSSFSFYYLHKNHRSLFSRTLLHFEAGAFLVCLPRITLSLRQAAHSLISRVSVYAKSTGERKEKNSTAGQALTSREDFVNFQFCFSSSFFFSFLFNTFSLFPTIFPFA